MNNTSTSQTNIQIKLLISRLIDLDELELKIEEALQSISETDPLLVAEVQMKLSQGREAQCRARELLLKNSDTLSEEDVENARRLLKESQALKVNYPEVRNLELICRLLEWLRKVQSALETCVSPAGEASLKQDGFISRHFEKIERFLDSIREPEQIHGKTRWLLKPLINEFRNVEFGDERLCSLLRVLSQIVWAKDASDLLLRDNVMLSELRVLYETRVTGAESKFPQRERELMSLFEGQNDWTRAVQEFEETAELSKIDELLKGPRFESLLKGLISTLIELKSQFSDFQKITDLRDLRGKIESYIGWLEWAIEAEKLVRKTEHAPCEFRELDSLCASAKLKDVPRTWQILELLEAKFKQAVSLIDLCDQKLSDQLYKAAVENTEKLALSRGDEILREARALNEFVIVEKEIELIAKRLREVDAWKEKSQSFIMNYRSYLQSDSIYDEYLRRTLEEELLMIKADLSQLSFSLQAESEELWRVESCFKAWVLTKGKEKRSLEDWIKLKQALQKEGSSSDESQFLAKISEQIALYEKGNKALEELMKQDEKIFGNEKRKRAKASLVSLEEAQKLRESLDSCQIDFGDRRIFLDDFIHRGERLCDQYHSLLKERRHVAEFESLAENVRKLPLRLAFEQHLDEILFRAEKIADKLKRHNIFHKENVPEFIKEYQSQEVLFPELERMSKNWEQSELKIKEVARKAQDICRMSREELLKLSDEISEIPDEYTDDRVKAAKIEVFVRLADDFKSAWDSEAASELCLNYSGLRGLFNEAEQMKSQAADDARIANLHSFLESAAKEAGVYAQSIRTMDYMQLIEDEETKKLFRNVDFTEVIVERKMQLEYTRIMEQERQKELEARKKMFLKSLELSNKKNAATEKSFSIPPNSSENITRKLAVARVLPLNEGLEQLKALNEQKQPTKARSKKEPQAANSSKQPVAEPPSQKLANSGSYASSFAPQLNMKNIDVTSNQGRCLFVGGISRILEENTFIELPEILISEYSINIVDEIVRICSEPGKKVPAGQICQQVIDLFLKLRRFPCLTVKLAEEKFSFDLINKLRDKSDSYLESKERQIQMSQEGRNQKEESWGGKLKKKTPKHPQANVLSKRKADDPLTAEGSKRPHLNPTQPQQNAQKAAEEHKPKNLPPILQEILIQEESPVSAQKEGVPLSMKGLKERELLIRFRLERGTFASRRLFEDLSPLKKNTYEDINEVFSECEEDKMWKGTEPLREDELEDFQKFMKKHNKSEEFKQSKNVKPIMFDPDGDDHHQYLVMTQCNSENKLLTSKPEKGTPLKIFEGILKNFLEDYSPLVMMITNCDFDFASKFPNSSALNMKLHRRINRDMFEDQIDQLMKKLEGSGDKLMPGWFESPVLSTFDALNDIANDFNVTDQVGVMKWSRKCRVYVMHREMMSVTWRLKLNFRQGLVNTRSKKESNLVFIVRHKPQPMEEIKAFISPVPAEMPSEERANEICQAIQRSAEKGTFVEKFLSNSGHKHKSAEKSAKKLKFHSGPAQSKGKQPTLLDKFRNLSEFAKDIKEFSVKVDDLREEEQKRNQEMMRKKQQQAKRKAFLQNRNNAMQNTRQENNGRSGQNSELLAFVSNFRANMQNRKPEIQESMAETMEISEPALLPEYNQKPGPVHKVPTPSKSVQALGRKPERAVEKPIKKKGTPNKKSDAPAKMAEEPRSKSKPQAQSQLQSQLQSQAQPQSQRVVELSANNARKSPFAKFQKEIECEDEPEEPMLVEEDCTDYEPSVHLEYSPSKLVTEDEEIDDEMENHPVEKDDKLEQKIISLVQETARKPSVGKMTPSRVGKPEEDMPSSSITDLLATINSTLNSLMQTQKNSGPVAREEQNTVMQTPFNKNKDYRSSYFNTNSSFKRSNNFDLFNFSQKKMSVPKSPYANPASNFNQQISDPKDFERGNYGYKGYNKMSHTYLEEEAFSRPNPRFQGNRRSFTPSNRISEFQPQNNSFNQGAGSQERSFTPRGYQNQKNMSWNNPRRYNNTPNMHKPADDGSFEEYNFNDISNSHRGDTGFYQEKRNNYQNPGFHKGMQNFNPRYKNNGFYQNNPGKRNFAIKDDEVFEKENNYLAKN